MSAKIIDGLKPELVWQRFYDITQVPRPSKKEEKVLAFLKEYCDRHSFIYRQDKTGNIVIDVPASPGFENSPIVVVQGHVDMVCEKNKGTMHDFDNDPIKLKIEDGWITAEGTTLGADNGIGVAAGLALAEDKSFEHGPLEILLTVDEETGLTGANNLEGSFVQGRTLLNLDSEEDGAFYVGCSGGQDTLADFIPEFEAAKQGYDFYELLVSGLKGGHSGLDIQTERGNAIKILARTLRELLPHEIQISEITGGSKRNAIPREAEAVIAVAAEKIQAVESALSKLNASITAELGKRDPGLTLTLNKKTNAGNKVYTGKFAVKIIDVLLALPHGVLSMSADIPGLVETSTNLATVTIEDSIMRIGTSQRSSVDSAIKSATESVRSVFRLAGASRVFGGDGYPGWKPDMDSLLLKNSLASFNKLHGKDPEIKAIHAGLECGILGSKYPGMEMISFGPTIMGAHSPDEKLKIDDVPGFYALVKEIIKSYAVK
ncbi:MAG: aminoacyl-histidine dipeptidase [Ignavibacteriales bacterium]|nr:aminoacyl-histidine dipeptidase [Ignavibacteriales bacterium]MCF8307036.1 aminoacyl-histidine dipeptidase [Ignavibacteriales bacterium]MCF8316659.1 aminoacyl-histidine dipeptidase [Ignavibacteriales bacterium]MCF8438315.1 aminoacyl-histidine dipeptidase [Ignavibacteriales bacterium]